MNLFDQLHTLLLARRRSAQKRQLPRTQVYIQGVGRYEVKDMDTGQVLGERPTYTEARTLADSMERGELSA